MTRAYGVPTDYAEVVRRRAELEEIEVDGEDEPKGVRP